MAWVLTASRTALAMLVVVTGMAVAGAPAALAQDDAPKRAFVRELQDAVRKDDRAWLAAHIHFPLRHHGRVASIVRDQGDFIRNYAQIISDRLRAAILAQQPDRVFENWQGMMIGDGMHNVWVRETGEGDAAHYEIVTINDSR